MPGKKEKQPLSVTHPELAKEAVGWDATSILPLSKHLEWICPNGHSYTARINDRTRGRGCAVCSGRKVQVGINDLVTTHPAVAAEAFGWDPREITSGSNRKLEWECKTKHRWEETPNKRTGRGDGCPYCSGNRVLIGFNDLAFTHPDLSKEVDGWDPREYSAGSNKKLGWKCKFDHRWTAVIAARTGKLKTGCPVCANQIVLSGFNDLATKFPQLAMDLDGWDATTLGAGSNRRVNWKCNLGHKWNAQVSSRTALNTGCPVCANLKIQIGFNDLATTHPGIAFEAYGWDPKETTSGSGKKLQWKCPNGHIYSAPPVSRTLKNTGCSICANKTLLVGFNDLATTHPEIAKEAFGWDPKEVNAGRGLQKSGKSNQRRKWQCLLGHIWETTPSSRTSSYHQSGCPICAGNQLLVGFNDLATTHPDLALEAFGWNPEAFVAGGKEKKKWKCIEQGHIWKVSISERKAGRGCPSCAQTGFDPNKDGWLYFLVHQIWDMFQIGITNVPDDRLSKHSRLGWELLELLGPMDGHLTQQWETAILRMLKAKGADLSNIKIAGKFDGYSEAWSKSSFEVKSIKELMKLTEEFEEGK